MTKNSNYMSPEAAELLLDSNIVLCASNEDATVVEGWEWDSIE